MNHSLMTLAFIMYSLVIVFLLAYTDPRRNKLSNKNDNLTNKKMVLSVTGRKLLAWSLILPFVP
ncbi:hypothetical protein, partial [Paraglaciecola sp.]|uniref:hypothetical protein n=1 Tax=Paraglaciecola sp. TaxID=1920173 RepID=UPI00273EDFDF